MKKAVVIEDNIRFYEDTIKPILDSEEFKHCLITNFSEADQFLTNFDESTDLIILDRKLPKDEIEFEHESTNQESSYNPYGDTLLNKILSKEYSSEVLLQDTCIISFTAYEGEDQKQLILDSTREIYSEESGDINIKNLLFYKKEDALKLRKIIKKYSHLLNMLQDIEVNSESGEDLSDLDKRIIRRFAFQKKSTSVKVKKLSGGLSGTKVWMCEFSSDTDKLGRYILKADLKTPRGAPIESQLPRSYVATTLGEPIKGLCHGYKILAMQPAGDNDMSSLMDVIISDQRRATKIVDDYYNNAMKKIKSREVSENLSSFIEPILPLEKAKEISDEFGITLPRFSLNITYNKSSTHSDLHPFNMLVDDKNDTAVLIDFDLGQHHSRGLDLVTLALSIFSHKESKIELSDYPSADEVVENFEKINFDNSKGYNCYLNKVLTLAKEFTGNREYWALIIAYSLRQLKYPDVKDEPVKLDFFIKICEIACTKLIND